MRDDLLGYLLGSLEPDEVERVEEALRHDPQLQRELEVLHECFVPLEADAGHVDPPAGLARRTCQHVTVETVRATRVETSGGRSRWQFQDFMVAAGILVAASMLFFPAVSHSRFQAQLAMCQNNLRMIGHGLSNYSHAHASVFPAAKSHDGRVLPSAFAVLLTRNGYLEGAHVFVCPSTASDERSCFRLPTTDEIDRCNQGEINRLAREIGGSYAMTSGYTDARGYHDPCDLGRSTFALVADAPCLERSEHQSSNHGGDGQNVLFEDGHVAFLRNCLCEAGTGGDDIFRNDAGQIGVGNHRDDSVITSRPINPSADPAAAGE